MGLLTLYMKICMYMYIMLQITNICLCLSVNSEVFYISQKSYSNSLNCVVPENIHTPTTEGIGNSRGVGGSKAQEIPERWGIVSEITFPDGQVRC